MAKQVFSNNQLAHVWANQSQESGRNAGGRMYFHGTQIWSYGSHYLMGEIHVNSKGQKYALINAHGYSMSTGQQRNQCMGALQGLMPFFFAEDPSNPKTAVSDSVNNLVDHTFNHFKGIKLWSDNIEWTLEKYADHNTLCDTVEMPKHKMEFTEDLQELFKEHYLLRKQREAELNTPEMLAKKEAQKERKEALAAEKALRIHADRIQAFKDFDTPTVPGLNPQLIRIKKDIVQTSGGAEVPLNDALALLAAIDNGTVKQGMSVGNFSYDLQDSDIVKIGCHNISITHARTILKPRPLLSVV